MEKLYTFMQSNIEAGKTVLVYDARSNTPKKHVMSMDRVTMSGCVVYVDGSSVKGMTVCVKP